MMERIENGNITRYGSGIVVVKDIMDEVIVSTLISSDGWASVAAYIGDCDPVFVRVN